MGPRPDDLNFNDHNADDPSAKDAASRFPFYMDLPSPRVGEVPPALSPLDAFALQSRLLARRFQLEAQNGRRISRLPTDTVAEQLANRGGYFRGVNGGSYDNGMGEVPEVQEDTFTSSPTAASDGFVPRSSSRPVSQYPMFENINTRASALVMDNGPKTAPSGMPSFLGQRQQVPDYFAISVPRTSSPEPVEGTTINIEAPSPMVPSLTHSVDSVHSSVQPRTREGTIGSLHSSKSQKSLRSDRGLAPPHSPRFPKSPRSMQSIRSVTQQDSGDDDTASLHSGYAVASARKMSTSSNMSTPQSPFSPHMNTMHRSPSITSEYSMNGGMPPLQRPPPFSNFSRPLSSAGSISRQSIDHRPSVGSRPSVDVRPSTDLPFRQTYNTTQNMTSNPTSRQSSSDDIPRRPSDPNSAPDPTDQSSYVYAKYSLPRGRNVDRNSSGRPGTNEWILQQFDWVDGPTDATAAPGAQAESDGRIERLRQDDQSVPRPVQQPQAPHRGREGSTTSISTVSSTRDKPVVNMPRNQERNNPRPTSPQRPTSAWERSGTGQVGKQRREPPSALELFPPIPANTEQVSPAFSDRVEARPGRSFIPDTSSAIRSHSADARTSHRASLSPSVQTESTDRTVRAIPLHQRALSSDLTPDEHLEIGIQAHSAGQLTKSTYHLRRAAHAGLPTAMLLYALACRHGWGMRANQEDGVMWLRKAIDPSISGSKGGLEDAASTIHLISSQVSSKPSSTASTAQEAKTRKAQLALAVYELGISYMNGWGCTKDRALAVRCYEVAGSWGDCDALAEAGFCYTQGLGVKKDLKRAAGYYRRAADGGMSMAGNSWIYKAKYMDAATSTPSVTSPIPPGSSHSSMGKRDKTGTPTKGDGFNDDKPKSRSRARSIFGGRRRDKDSPAPMPT
ncbi:Hypothetical protein R9X50_00539300 [Acrodontium crateriforme]|uniref:Mitosis inhibitor nif1 n=1 Tax=Acrodontium crateriforme TaxID=150365 RepID=A0AAQ3M986_9PEZI|nr:Hypothetical protein R9X50_00539300 [Acrodontium crateriforme]